VAEQREEHITITVAAERAYLSARTVRRYISRGLIRKPLTEGHVAELRRIRRLSELGINVAGIEVILHMRQQLESLQDEVRRIAKTRRPERSSIGQESQSPEPNSERRS